MDEKTDGIRIPIYSAIDVVTARLQGRAFGYGDLFYGKPHRCEPS